MASLNLTVILNVVFILILVIALLGGLAGFLKGIYKTTLKTIIKAILITIFVFTTPAISNGIGNINFSKFNISFSFNSTTIAFTTIQQTLADIITATGFVSPMNGLSLYETAIALANSILCYIVFFLIMLLIQIFISLITAIFYNGIFRWFLPVETKAERKNRKAAQKDKKKAEVAENLTDDKGQVVTTEKVKKKWPLLKLPGAALGTVQELIFVFILLAPVTSLLRTAVTNKDTIVSVANIKDENLGKEISTYMDQASDSILYKFSGLGEYDTKLMNNVSSVPLNDTTVSFSSLFNSTMDIVKTVLNTNCISYDSGSGQIIINLSVLVSVDTIDTLLTELIGNSTLMALLPPLIDIAINTVSGSSFPLDKLDFSNVDWTSDLEGIKDIYSDIYSTGIVSEFIPEGTTTSSKLSFDNFEMDFREPVYDTDGVTKIGGLTDTEFTTQVDYYASAVAGLGKLDIVKNNMPVILSGLGSALSSKGFTIFPTDKPVYKDIDWSTDLPLLVKSVFKSLRALNILVNKSLTASSITSSLQTRISNTTYRTELKNAVCGNTTDKGLLDSSLFSVIDIGQLVSSSLNSMASISKYVESIDLESALDLSVSEWKGEISSLFDIAGDVFSSGAIDFTKLDSIDISDPAVTELLVSVIDESSNSIILKKLIPPVLQSFLYNGKFDFSDYLYGLTPYDFNYDDSNFLTDLSGLLENLSSIRTMATNISNADTTEAKINAIDTTVVRKVLNIIANSDFFNPDQITGVTSTSHKNANMYTFLNNFFSSDAFGSFTVSLPSLDDFSAINWGAGVVGDGGEIDKLAVILDDAKSNSSLLSSSTLNLSSINNIDGLVDMVKDGMDSTILHDSILSIITSSINDSLSQMGIPLSLNELRNNLWYDSDATTIDDLDRVAAILKLLKSLNTDGSNLDLETIDATTLNSLLTNIADSHFINCVDSDDPFGTAIYSIFEKQGLFTSIGVTPNSSIFSATVNGYTWVKGETSHDFSYSYVENGETKKVNFSSVIDTSGEVSSLMTLLDGIKTTGFDNLKKGNLPTFESSFYNSSLIRNLYSFIIEQMVTNIDLGTDFTAVFKAVDFSMIRDKTKLSNDDLKAEITILQNLYSLSTADKNNNGTGDLQEIFSNFTSLKNGSDTTLFDEFSELMGYVGDSKLLTTKKDYEDLSPLAKLFYQVVKTQNIESMVTLKASTDPLIDDTLKGIVGNIKQSEWSDEANRFVNVADALQGIDINNITLNGLGRTKALSLFTQMNNSLVFHRLPISVLKDTLNTDAINKLLTDPDDSTKVHKYSWNEGLGTTASDISYWQNDYDLAVGLFFNEDGTATKFNTLLSSSADFSTISFNDIDTSFMYYLGEMHIFENGRSYILYNIMKTTAGTYMTSLLKSAQGPVPVGENAKVYRLEELFFSNPKLVDEDATKQKTKMLNDLSILNTVLYTLLNNVSSLSTVTDLSDLTLATDFFASINEKACSMTGADGTLSGTFYRSDFTSELLAGAESVFFSNPNLTSYFSALSTVDLYADSYALVNPIEGKAIDGIIAFAKSLATVTSATPYSFTKEQLKTLYSAFGKGNATVASDDVYNYFIGLSNYSTTGNSILGIKMSSYLFSASLVISTSVAIPGIIDPFNSIGSNGYYYIDTVKNKLYFKSNDAWSEITGTLTIGTSTPTTGSNGDYFYNSTYGTLLQKFNGNWLNISAGITTLVALCQNYSTRLSSESFLAIVSSINYIQ